jgi:hypothetical protein
MLSIVFKVLKKQFLIFFSLEEWIILLILPYNYIYSLDQFYTNNLCEDFSPFSLYTFIFYYRFKILAEIDLFFSPTPNLFCNWIFYNFKEEGFWVILFYLEIIPKRF